MAALEWLDPVFVGGHWVPQMIELAGGEDVLGLPGEKSRTVDWAEVEAAAPEVVVSMPCGLYAEEAAAETMRHREQLAALGARVVAVDAAAYFSRPGPRLVDGVELLATCSTPTSCPRRRRGARSRSTSSARADAIGRAVLAQPDATAIDAATAAAPSAPHEAARPPSAAHPVAQVEQHERGERAAEQPADVAADRDVRDRERDQRFSPIQKPRPLSIRFMPRLRMTITAAPISPKIAPEAPTVGEFGSSSSAPNDPASSDTK